MERSGIAAGESGRYAVSPNVLRTRQAHPKAGEREANDPEN